MDFMKLVHVSELNHVNDNQMVMVVGWVENYLPPSFAKLYSSENGSRSVVQLDLDGCDVVEVIQHGLFRVIGRYYHNNEGGRIKVQSLHSARSWNYHTVSQLIHEQRNFAFNHSKDTSDMNE